MIFDINCMSARKKQVNINLLVKEDFEVSFSGQVLSWALTYGRYIIIITQIVVLSVFFFRFRIDREHTDLKESVTQKQALLESISDLEMEIRNVQGKLSNIKKISQGQDSILKIIRFLQDNSPSDVTFASLSISKDKVSLAAVAGNLKSFSYFLNIIQADKKFTDTTLEDISRKTDGKVEFKVNTKANFGEFK